MYAIIIYLSINVFCHPCGVCKRVQNGKWQNTGIQQTFRKQKKYQVLTVDFPHLEYFPVYHKYWTKHLHASHNIQETRSYGQVHQAITLDITHIANPNYPITSSVRKKSSIMEQTLGI